MPPYAVMGQRKPTVMKDFLEEKFLLYNNPSFIETDPVSIPHLFSKKEDIEIAGFLAATIAWGQRPTILKNSKTLMCLMDDSPHEFITGFKEQDLKRFTHFVHRTFNGTDCVYFLKALKQIYTTYKGLENVFLSGLRQNDNDLQNAISHCRSVFFELPHQKRTEKHFSNPAEGSATKRINMFLRWMVRRDKCGVDFGIWKTISPSLLSCPLDVHSGRVARKLGLLKRKQNDWKATQELTASLSRFDHTDPVKYDFALFGLGVFEKF
ncbi:TIGR02757 family protein [soil metagenome]